MSKERPRLSPAKVGVASIAAVILLFIGTVQLMTEGRAFEVRGSNELSGGLWLIAGAALAFWVYGIAFKSKPSFTLHDDRVEHFSWKHPIYFRDVEEVVLEPATLFGRRAASVYFKLKSGSIQHIPYSLMTHGPEAFAELLTSALERFRAGQTG